MRALLYCVLREPSAPGVPVAGVRGRALTFVQSRGLSGAVSLLEDADLVPNVKRLLEYERAIEELFHRCTLIPMRYGSSFAGEAEVIRYLEEHAARLEALLGELDGCVEMGIRVLAPPDEQAGEPPPLPVSGPGAGRAYLDAQRRHFAALNARTEAERAIAMQVARAFEGLAVKHKMEPAGPDPSAYEQLLKSLGGQSGRVLLSMHFLVKRELVAEFQERFRALPSAGEERLLISGPWPPYNFVTP